MVSVEVLTFFFFEVLTFASCPSAREAGLNIKICVTSSFFFILTEETATEMNKFEGENICSS